MHSQPPLLHSQPMLPSITSSLLGRPPLMMNSPLVLPSVHTSSHSSNIHQSQQGHFLGDGHATIPRLPSTSGHHHTPSYRPLPSLPIQQHLPIQLPHSMQLPIQLPHSMQQPHFPIQLPHYMQQPHFPMQLPHYMQQPHFQMQLPNWGFPNAG